MRLLVIAFTLFLISTFVLLAKDPCSSVKIKTDAFGKTSKKGYVKLIEPHNEAVVYIFLKDSIPTLSFKFRRRGFVENEKAEIGTPGSIALVNNEIIDLSTTYIIKPTYSSSPPIFAYWEIEFPLNYATLEKLSSSPLKAIKTTVTGRDFSISASKRKGKKIMDIATCFFNSIEDKK